MQFRPDVSGLLGQLTVLAQPVRLTLIGSTQLRFEGIDALESHFSAPGGTTHQPLGLANDARNFLTKTFGLDPVTYKPGSQSVQPPAPNDGARGYILSRSLDVHGRPVSFVFAGDPPEADGTAIFLDV